MLRGLLHDGLDARFVKSRPRSPESTVAYFCAYLSIAVDLGDRHRGTSVSGNSGLRERMSRRTILVEHGMQLKHACTDGVLSKSRTPSNVGVIAVIISARPTPQLRVH